MDLFVIVAIGIGALLVGFLLALWLAASRAAKRERTQRLRSYFSDDEYRSTIEEKGRKQGEAELERRIEEGDVHPTRIAPEQRSEYTDRWREIQYRFVDDPTASVRDAEHLVVDAMTDRGFTVDDISSRAAALSVEQEALAERYHDAYDVHRRAEEGDHGLESLLEALRTYREVFDAVLLRPQREKDTAEAAAPDDAPIPSSGT